MGTPRQLRLIELGPGRGTLLRDAVRAATIDPEFIRALELHLVEISPVLEALQQQTLVDRDLPKLWHKALGDVPPGPSIIIANEFFDALPINQAVKQDDGWHARCVGIGEDGQFAYVVSPEPLRGFERTVPPQLRAAQNGEVFEWRSDVEAMELARRVARDKSAALVIDYGHTESGAGETLQAVHKHLFADPLTTPGEADLTAHVDFQELARAVEAMGVNAYGPLEQAAFLNRLGIQTRAQNLKANLPRAEAHEIDQALARLTGIGRTGMGTLFKVMAFTCRGLPAPPGFEH
jgi:SAM-dependent MidA family methyltransferase